VNSNSSNTKLGASTGKRVCFVYKEDYPWDVRVEKILLALSAAEYKMSLVCRNTKRRSRQETTANFDIFRLPALPGFLGKLGSLLSTPFYFNPFWLFWMWYYARSIKPQLIIIRDLPLMPLGIVIGKLLGIRIIFDMAECYPEMYASTMKFSNAKVGKFVLKNPGLARMMEKFSFRHASHIFVMIEESRDRLIRLGADPAKITIVSNTPTNEGVDATPNEGQYGLLRLLYVGYVTRIRGIDNVLHGLRAYLDGCDNPVRIQFDVVGIGAALTYYRQLCKELQLESHVTFHGWCEQEIVDELYASSDLGILTYHVCSHWNNTIPNKLFDYMQAGMPVLATDVVPIKRIVEEEGCGMIFPDNDATSFAACLEVLSDPARRIAMGLNGIKAVKNRYSWEIDTTRMLGSLSGLSPN